jgi:hypothetical protein
VEELTRAELGFQGSMVVLWRAWEARGVVEAAAWRARRAVGAKVELAGCELPLPRAAPVSTCSEHGPNCHLFELILVIHANTSNGTNLIV